MNRFICPPPFLAPRAALGGPGRGPSLAVGPVAAHRGIHQNGPALRTMDNLPQDLPRGKSGKSLP